MQLLKLLNRWLPKRQSAPAAVKVVQPVVRVVREIQVAPPEKAVRHGTPVYPPIDPGLLIDDPRNILASQDELIDLLRRNLGLPENEFDRKYLQPILRVAEFINLLPATRDKHHAGAGGLFRLCLSMGVRSAQSSEGRIFASSEGIERRRQAEQSWRHAAFLTGLCSELCRPLADLIVVDDEGEQWSPYVSTLTKFAHERGADRIYVRWFQRDDQRSAVKSMTSWAINLVVGNEILSELNSVKPLIVETIFGVATGSITSADNNTMSSLITDVRRRVIERDNEIAPITYGKLTQGSHLEPYLLDAMRSLLRSGKWQVNVRGARCHYGSDGFFIAWRQGADEILDYLKAQNIEGIPANRETLEDMLGAAGIIAPGNNNSRLHMVQVFGTQPFVAIRLQSPGAVIGTLDIKPVSTPVKSQNVQAVPAAQTPKPVITPETKPDLPKTTAQAITPVAEPSQAPTVVKTFPVIPDSPLPNGKDSNVENKIGTDRVVEVEQSQSKTPQSESAVSHDAIATTEAQSKTSASSPPKPDAAASGKSGKSGQKQAERTEEKIESLPPELLVDLGSPLCKELAVLRSQWNRGQGKDKMFRTPEGLAVAYSWIEVNFALDWIKAQDLLKTAGYLATTQISGKTRILTNLPFPKGDELGVVFLNAFLVKAGFVLE